MDDRFHNRNRPERGRGQRRGFVRAGVPLAHRHNNADDWDDDDGQPIRRQENGHNRGGRGGQNIRNNRGGMDRGGFGRGGRGRRPDGRPRVMNYTFLQRLDIREPDDIILTLFEPNSGFKEALIVSQDKPDQIRLILSVLAKACSSQSMPQMLLQVFNITKEAGFFDTVLNYFLDISEDDTRYHQREIQKPIKDCIFLLKELSIQSPSNITHFLGIHSGLQVVIDSLRERPGSIIDTEILDGFKEFTEQKDKLLRRVRRARNDTNQDGIDTLYTRIDDEEPPNDFRDIEIFPQTIDMQVDERPFLRKNKITGAYSDVNNYLDIQFRLLREDFIGPLRDGIGNYIQAVQERGLSKKIQEIRIYPNVQVISPISGDNGLCHVLHFDVSRLSRVRWQSTKRLIFGSLLCLSPDNFNTFYFATVTHRESKELEQGLIHVRFEHDLETINSFFGRVFTMAETTAYFESYRHVLSGLQKTLVADFPFEKYIVKCQGNEVTAPAYLRRRPATNFDLRPLVDETVPLIADTRLENLGELVEGTKLYNFSPESRVAKDVSLLDRNTWPPADLLKLDASQFEAIYTALTREFVITQGPPGTGKTYIGLKIVKALLHNKGVWSLHPDTGNPDPRPMLIVCYTNHALDQFLEGIIRFFKGDVLRVGGRSSSELLKDYSLYNFRQRFRHAQKVPVAVFQGRRAAKDEMEDLKDKINKIAAQIQIGMTTIIHEDFLQPFMGLHYRMLNQQFQEMLAVYPEAAQFIGRRHSVIVEWLGLGSLAPIVEMEANFEPAMAMPVGEEGQQDPEDEFIDVEEEVDAIEAQRMLEGADDDFDLEEVLDEFSDLSVGAARRKAREVQFMMGVKAHRGKAVALDVSNMEKRQGGADGGDWQQTKKQKKKLKRNIQRNLASAEIMADEDVRNVRDLWRMTPEEKWALYRKWIRDYCQYLCNEISEKQAEYEGAAARYKEAAMQEDKEIMRHATVIGMTTTGAARYQSVLQDIRPRIIVVEEAAEVLEAHIITTLSRGCEHLILIGDHQQLRPSPTVYKLAKDYNLDVSLFERMIRNGMKCDQLCLQHRMRPEIAELMHHIYDNLSDHEDVKHYENIKGISKNMFFINHKEPESHDDDLRSHSNEHEANFTAGLCRYLLHQGYKPSQITVLTMYSGQLFCLKNKMPKTEFDGVRVTVVDNFQGEENDIILLSLVRSNEDGHIGFLKVNNRVCVALSRAKKGFYVIGNFDMLASRSDLWKEITIGMKNNGLQGEALQLYCQNHPNDDSILARSAADFSKAPEGGCDKKCEYRLECGHVCSMYCHVNDPHHKDYECRKPCGRKLCDNNHRCTRKCYQACGECDIPMEKMIPKCKHKQLVPCHLRPERFTCMEDCRLVLDCGHKCQSFCGMACTPRCKVLIDHVWPCGHKERIHCHEQHTAPCPVPCQVILSCEHPCSGTCGSCFQGRLHQPCTKDCTRPLVCGHSCRSNCNNCPPCTRACENRCKHSRCRRKCGEVCAPCMEPCEWNCEHHRCSKLCSEPCDRERCNEPCRKRLVCGHICIGLCGEICPTDCRVCDQEKVTTIVFGDEDEPDAKFVLLEDCKHIIESNALDQWMDQTDDSTTTIQLKRCPHCRTPIRKSFRYGTIINNALNDIETVKKRMLGNQNQVKELERDIERTLDRSSGEYKRIFQKRLEHMKRPKTEQALTALVNQIAFMKNLKELEKDWDTIHLPHFSDLKTNELKLFNHFYNWLVEDRSQMSEQETTDAERELKRSRTLLGLTKVQQSLDRNKLEQKVKKEIQEVERLLERTYSEDLQHKAQKLIKYMKKVGNVEGLGITEEERVMIVKAVGLSQGHWYKCPNGHVYAIGECGGATQSGMCPECQAAIGGQSHQLATGNALAPVMDGARFAAYSEEANMNLNLVDII